MILIIRKTGRKRCTEERVRASSNQKWDAAPYNMKDNEELGVSTQQLQRARTRSRVRHVCWLPAPPPLVCSHEQHAVANFLLLHRQTENGKKKTTKIYKFCKLEVLTVSNLPRTRICPNLAPKPNHILVKHTKGKLSRPFWLQDTFTKYTPDIPQLIWISGLLVNLWSNLFKMGRMPPNSCFSSFFSNNILYVDKCRMTSQTSMFETLLPHLFHKLPKLASTTLHRDTYHKAETNLHLYLWSEHFQDTYDCQLLSVS